jgi:hypothetical protein
MRRGAQRIEGTVAPFARFVRAEQEKTSAQREALEELEQQIIMLQGQLESVG